MNKWKNTRDNFMRTVKKSKSGDGAQTSRQYVYARQLSFLLGNTALACTEASIVEETPSADGTRPGEEMCSIDARRPSPLGRTNVEEHPAKKKKHAHASGRQSLEESLITYINTPIPTETPKPSSPLLTFFESLRPAVDLFTVDEQLELQTEVLNTVKRIRTRSLDFQHLQYQQSPRNTYSQPNRYYQHPHQVLVNQSEMPYVAEPGSAHPTTLPMPTAHIQTPSSTIYEDISTCVQPQTTTQNADESDESLLSNDSFQLFPNIKQ